MGGRGTSSGVKFDNQYDAFQWFGVNDMFSPIPMYDNWAHSINTAEKDAVVDYTGPAYAGINTALRDKGYNGLSADMKNTVDNLDSAIAKFKLDRQIIVTRGSTADLVGGFTTAAEINANLKGAIVRDDGFMSTSVVSSSAFGTAVRYEITVPRGKGRGAFVAPVSKFKNENEFLLKRGTKFKILGATTDTHGKITVKMRVVK